MAQTEGNINIVIKNGVSFNKKGVWTAGDGSTAHDVLPREAIAAAMSGSIKADTDVLMDETDFRKLVHPANEPTNAAGTSVTPTP